MEKLLITGGTVFVSRFAAAYFVSRGYEVWVLNRNTREQVPGVHLIEADRKNLGNALKDHTFDAVLDINSYTAEQVEKLLDALGSFRDYIFISSSAVYPESLPQPFSEEQPCGPNAIWGAYGTNKLAAENALQERVPHAYILRPPYLYGPMENVYREPFVFDCADRGYAFCLPEDGKLKLQFFHVEDLCRFMELLLKQHPQERIFNVGNPEPVTAEEWAKLCYRVAGTPWEAVRITGHPQRNYFPFYPYEYMLDVTKQQALMPRLKPLEEGLREACAWHREHPQDVIRKPFLEYIDKNSLIC